MHLQGVTFNVVFRHIQTGCSAMKLILKNFASVIKSNIDSAPGVNVDISREER